MAVTYNIKGTPQSSFKVGKQGAGTVEIGGIDATGNSSVATVTGSLVPSANITYDLGSSSLMWRDLYVGPGSIYVNGKKVIEDNAGTINITTDENQNLTIATSGTGETTMSSASGLNFSTSSTGDITFTTASGQIEFDGDIIVNAAKSISSSNAEAIAFADPISVTGNSEMANLTVTGNLTVQGTTTTIDSTTVQIQNAFVFEGATDDGFETTLTVADPTADRTITLPDATGTVALTSDLTSYITASSTDTLTNKTIDTANNTITIVESDISDLGAYITASSTDTLTNKTLSATTIAGHLIPDTDVTYDLGTSSNRFRDIYLSGTTIDLGGAKLSNDGSNNLDIKDGDGNRKTLRASSIELVDSTGKIMRLERDASSGKLKQSRKNSDGSDEGIADTIDIVGDTSPQLGGTLDANGNDIDMGTNTITDAKVGNWDTAYGWGDHSIQGYLTAVSSSDVTQHQGNLTITESQISDLGTYLTAVSSSDVTQHQGNLTITESQISDLSHFSGSYTDLTDKPTIPTNNNQLTNGAGYITASSLSGLASESYVDTQISNLVASAPATLDTLNELAAALGDDANFATTVTDSIATKLNTADLNSGIDTHLNQSDPTAGYVLSWNGTDYAWVEQSAGGGTYSAQSTAPSSPSAGDEWFDTDTGDFYKYINDGTTSQWVEWSPGSGGAQLDGTTEITGTITPSTDNTHALGSSSKKFSAVHSNSFEGTATSAQYADLAEMYAGDQAYEPGTVVVVGGTHEVTQCIKHLDSSLAGVVSEKPGYLMNKDIDAEYPVCVGFVGRVPVKVVGHIEKGDLLTTSSVPGFATKYTKGSYEPGCIIGVALNTKNEIGEGTVEVLLKRS